MTAPSLKHAKVLAQADGPDPTLILPSNWNAEHDLTYGALPFYDEGIWTPVLSCATPGTLARTYSTQTGQWTRVGRMVAVSFRIDLTSFTLGTATGEVRITGLPWPTNASFQGYGSCMTNGMDNGGASIGLYIPSNVSHFVPYASNDNGGWSSTQIGGVASGDGIIGNAHYFM